MHSLAAAAAAASPKHQDPFKGSRPCGHQATALRTPRPCPRQAVGASAADWHPCPRGLCPMSCRKRQRGDLNPCGQSPMDFEAISLAARTHCLNGVADMAAMKIIAINLCNLSTTCSAIYLHPQVHAWSSAMIYIMNFDSEGIRTPAGRAQWISSPSP